MDRPRFARWLGYAMLILVLVATRHFLSSFLRYHQTLAVTMASVLALLSGAYFFHLGVRGVTPDMVNPKFTRVMALAVGGMLLLGGSAGTLWLLSDDFPTPERVAQARIAKVRRTANPALDLSDLQLTALPSEIKHLVKLRYLNLSHNRLTKLPADIGTLRQLQSLQLSHNRLTTLPPEIGALDQLTRLEACGNRLTHLPPEIGQLTDLEHLDLADNQLAALPPTIGQLTHLKILYLTGNPLETLPPELEQLTQENALNLIYARDNTSGSDIPLVPVAIFLFAALVLILCLAFVLNWWRARRQAT